MTKGFKMKLLPGTAVEYERRHAAIWPEMKAMISSKIKVGVDNQVIKMI